MSIKKEIIAPPLQEFIYDWLDKQLVMVPEPFELGSYMSSFYLKVCISYIRSESHQFPREILPHSPSVSKGFGAFLLS